MYCILLAGAESGEFDCVGDRVKLQPVAESFERQSTNLVQCRGRNSRPFCHRVESKTCLCSMYCTACNCLTFDVTYFFSNDNIRLLVHCASVRQMHGHCVPKSAMAMTIKIKVRTLDIAPLRESSPQKRSV